MPFPPLGALYAISFLRQRAMEPLMIDGMMPGKPDSVLRELSSTDYDALVIYDDEFNYLTKMCLHNMRDHAVALIHQAVQRRRPVLVYSSDATDHPGLYLKAGATAVLQGEAEETLATCIRSLESDRFEDEKHDITGLSFLNGPAVKSTGRPPLRSNLDDLPDPAYDAVDHERYRREWQTHHGFYSVNISTTRGCPYHCNWCAKPIYGQVYHAHSPERTMALIQSLKSDHDADHLWITDDIFGLKPGWLARFCEIAEVEGHCLPYKCLSRSDLLLRNNALELLRRSGCETVWIGAESGSQKILDAMEKGIQVEKTIEAIEKAHALGIHVGMFIQFGYPGETWSDIGETRRLIKTCLPEDLGISISYPLPGTKFHDRVSKQVTAKTQWDDSDDMDPLYAAAFSKMFYKRLHRFIHAEYRMALALTGFRVRYWLRAPLYLLRWLYYGLRLKSELRKT